MDNTEARSVISIACYQGVDNTQEVGGILVEGGAEVIEGERPHWGYRQSATHLPQPSTNQEVDKLPQLGTKGEMSHVCRPKFRPWPRDSPQSGGLVLLSRQRSPPSPSSASTETLDLTQYMEVNNHASFARSSDETVDWSQSAGGDLGNLLVLDPDMCEFLLGTEASGSRGDEPD